MAVHTDIYPGQYVLAYVVLADGNRLRMYKVSLSALECGTKGSTLQDPMYRTVKQCERSDGVGFLKPFPNPLQSVSSFHGVSLIPKDLQMFSLYQHFFFHTPPQGVSLCALYQDSSGLRIRLPFLQRADRISFCIYYTWKGIRVN